MNSRGRSTKSTNIEIVETHNMTLALKRMHNAPAFDCNRWRRSLYHALSMSGVADHSVSKIRQALDLP